MKQKTITINGQKVTTRIRRRTHLGNHLGWTVWVGETKRDFFILSPQEAMDKAIAKYTAATAAANAAPPVSAAPSAGDAQGGGVDGGDDRSGDGTGSVAGGGVDSASGGDVRKQ